MQEPEATARHAGPGGLNLPDLQQCLNSRPLPRLENMSFRQFLPSANNLVAAAPGGPASGGMISADLGEDVVPV